MSRIWIILIALLAGACASAPMTQRVSAGDTYFLYPYGTIFGPGEYSASPHDVGEIGPALDAFLGPEGDSLILLPNHLDRAKLDFSVESLGAIDYWLKQIHTINKLQAEEGRAGEYLMQDGRGDNSVVFAGLYLGEVIRANSNLNWQWQPFEVFVGNNPYFTEHYGTRAGLDSFVLVGPQGAATPINTALKRVINGKESSVEFVGNWLLDPVNLQAATSGQDFYGLTDIR